MSNGSVPVTAVFKTNSGFLYAGSIVAESNCWSMLKGGLTVNSSGPAELYFEVILNTCRQERTSSLLVINVVRSCELVVRSCHKFHSFTFMYSTEQYSIY